MLLLYSKMEVLLLQASVKVTENGSFNVFNRSQEFRFTPEGLFRRKGKSRGPSRVEEEELSFKVSTPELLVDADVGV